MKKTGAQMDLENLAEEELASQAEDEREQQLKDCKELTQIRDEATSQLKQLPRDRGPGAATKEKEEKNKEK